MARTVDLTGETVDTLDQEKVDPGWYRCQLVATEEEAEKGNQVFRFKVVSQRFSGWLIEDQLSNPEFVADDRSRGFAVKREKMYLSRLGLVGKDQVGKVVEIDFAKALGRECVVHVTNREYEKDGQKKQAVGVDFAGIYPLDHEKVPVEVRQLLGLPLLPGQVAPTPLEAAHGKLNKAAAGAAAKRNGQPAAPPAGEIDVSEI